MLINTAELLLTTIRQVNEAKIIAVDTETDGLDIQALKLVGISIAYRTDKIESFYIPVGHNKIEAFDTIPEHLVGSANQLGVDFVIKTLKPILENPEIKTIWFNAKFDMQVFKKYGVEVAQPYYDSQIACWLYNENVMPRSLKNYTKVYLKGEPKEFDALLKEYKAKTIADVPIEAAMHYAQADAHNTYALYSYFAKTNKLEVEGVKNLFEKIEMPLIRPLLEMEWAGILINKSLKEELKLSSEVIIKELEATIKGTLGNFTLNINSPAQLGKVLYETLGIEPLGFTKKTDKPAMTESILEKLAIDYPLAEKILEYKTYFKLYSTFIEGMGNLTKEDGRIHTNFNQCQTVTGRLSSNSPNLQNIPKKKDTLQLRRLFIPPEGYKFIKADYNQMELRVLAHFSGDKYLTNAFNNNFDIHERVAQECKITRDIAKTINFGLIYGMQAFGLAKRLKIDEEEANDYIVRYFSLCPGVKTWIESTKKSVLQVGYTRTYLGRKRRFPRLNPYDRYEVGSAQRQGVNHVIQGTSADIVKLALINTYKRLKDSKLDARILLQVHDELLIEVKESEAQKAADIVKYEMENAVKLRVALPVEVEILDNWYKEKE